VSDEPLTVERARALLSELCAQGVISEKARDSMLPFVDERMLRELRERRLRMLAKMREGGTP
jgi:hypothetical protein